MVHVVYASIDTRQVGVFRRFLGCWFFDKHGGE